MTEAELLASLADQCVWVGPAVEVEAKPPITEKKVKVIELGEGGTWSPSRWHPYTVIAAGTPQESANGQQLIRRPVNDTLTAIAYLEGLKASGTIEAYKGVEEFPDLRFFIARVWVASGDGTESEQRIRVEYDGSGNATHSVVV